MVKSALGKVMWVGRATVFLVGLAVILALVVGLASTALAANGANFIIGNGLADTARNIATKLTKLTMQGTNSGPALQVNQQSTNTGASGVGVTVPSGKAPIKVNSTAGKATNLSADKLDGKDSTALGVTTKTAQQPTNQCTTVNVWNPCAEVKVIVPAGKQYNVTVLSSSNVTNASRVSFTLYYCPLVKGGAFTQQHCITEGRADQMNLWDAQTNLVDPKSAATSGSTGPLPAGTYTFSTDLFPSTTDGRITGPNGDAHTTVMVTDASVPGPPIQ
jgi:hypothetical protein